MGRRRSVPVIPPVPTKRPAPRRPQPIPSPPVPEQPRQPELPGLLPEQIATDDSCLTGIAPH